MGQAIDDLTLWDALEQAQAAEFARALNGSLDAKLGSSGTQLSGGQRQRLAIARALLVRAPILVLDEATSALDNLSERAFQNALRTLAKDHAVLVIAHRLSTIRDADEIVVMADGRIVERGQHADLMANGGLYQQLQTSAETP